MAWLQRSKWKINIYEVSVSIENFFVYLLLFSQRAYKPSNEKKTNKLSVKVGQREANLQNKNVEKFIEQREGEKKKFDMQTQKKKKQRERNESEGGRQRWQIRFSGWRTRRFIVGLFVNDDDAIGRVTRQTNTIPNGKLVDVGSIIIHKQIPRYDESFWRFEFNLILRLKKVRSN